MSEEKKVWRTRSEYFAPNVRIMKIDEPREISEEVTLCSFSFVDQSGNEKTPDFWVRVTGANGLAERIFNSRVGDRVNVSGKPTVRAYINKAGEAVASMEIQFPVIDFLTPLEKSEDTQPEPEEEEETAPVVEKRKPGRPKKELPFPT